MTHIGSTSLVPATQQQQNITKNRKKSSTSPKRQATQKSKKVPAPFVALNNQALPCSAAARIKYPMASLGVVQKRGGSHQRARRTERIALRGKTKREDCAKRQNEKIGLRQEAQGTETIVPRGTRNGYDHAKRHKERRRLRQEARGTETIAPRGARNRKYRVKRCEERRVSCQEAQRTRTGAWRQKEWECEGTVPQQTRMARNVGTSGNVEERRRGEREQCRNKQG